METSSDREFLVQFWGVRGSIPAPGKETERYGGNTSCVEMRIGGKRLIFDGGTGLHVLGNSLLKQMPVEAYMFFTHYHWDHIQGVPMFAPIFIPGNCFKIYGAIPSNWDSTQQHFEERILHPNSPLPKRPLAADLKFHELEPGNIFHLDDIRIETGHLNHPNGAMGYRISYRNRTAVYCTDTEHFPDRLDKPDRLDQDVLKLSRNADILIYDAMYTDEEYYNPKSPKQGWGHSTWQAAVEIAKEAGVKQVVIFHHEPNHSDDFLDNLAQEVKAVFPKSILAKEGAIIDLHAC